MSPSFEGKPQRLEPSIVKRRQNANQRFQGFGRKRKGQKKRLKTPFFRNNPTSFQ